jgi:glycosyltransferase involved in cell wall biosynthesis
MDPKEFCSPDRKRLVDFVVLQRQYGTPNLNNTIYMKNKLGIKCIYECDDALFHIPEWNPAFPVYNKKYSPERHQNIESFLRTCDALTVSTECLKRMFSKYNPNIYVLPNAIDFDLFPDVPAPVRPDNDVRIGWFGSSTHLKDLQQCVSAVEQIIRDFPQTKLFVGGWDGVIRGRAGDDLRPDMYVWKNIPPDRIIKHPWTSIENYHKMISEIDISLTPLEENAFNNAKSNIKVLESWSCKVPVVASKVEPYEQTITHGKNGLLVQTKGSVHKDWYQKIKQLVLNPELRKQLGQAGYAEARDRYDIAKNVNKWVEVWEQICQKS